MTVKYINHLIRDFIKPYIPVHIDLFPLQIHNLLILHVVNHSPGLPFFLNLPVSIRHKLIPGGPKKPDRF